MNAAINIPAARTSEETAAAEVVADILTQRGYLFELRVSQWSGKARLTEDDLGLSGLTSAELHRLGHRHLVPKEKLAAVSAIATRARVRIQDVSYAFPIGGARFVPVAVLGPLLADLSRIKAQFDEAVTAFGLHYEETTEQHRAVWIENATKLSEERELGAEWLEAFKTRLEECYPPQDEVIEAFGMAWSLFQFSLPKGVRAQLVQSEQALEGARLADEARRAVEQQVAGFVSEAALELRRRAGECCAHVAKQVQESGEKISERSLQPLRDLIAQFRNLDFTGDESFAVELETFAQQHLTTGTAKNARESADYRASLATALTTMSEKAVGESEAAARAALDRFLTFGREGRAVEG